MTKMTFVVLCAVLLIVGCAPQSPPAPAAAATTAPASATPPTGNNVLPSPDQLWDVNSVTCGQWTDASDEDRAAVGMFYYGWLAGAHGIHSLRPVNIQPNLRKVLDFCIQNRDTTIVKAFQATLGSRNSS